MNSTYIEAYTTSGSGAFQDTRRSVLGTVGMLAKEAVILHSRQAAMASGTLEVTYVALSEAVKEVILLRRALDFMAPSMKIDVVNAFEDNEGAIKIVVNKHGSRRTKHTDVKYHLVRDACHARKIRVMDVRTEDEHADLFKKPLDMQKFHKHAKKVLNVV